MNLSFEGHDDVVVVRLLSSRFEAESSDEFRKRMTEHIAAGIQHYVLDLSAVKFMDSGALGAVLSIVKALPSTGDLRLAAVNESVLTVLRLTRIDKVLSIFDEVEDAIRSFGPSGS